VCCFACHQETAVTGTTDTRDPIAIQYAGVSELPVHAKPDDHSKVVTKYLSGESVSILSRKGDWSEVRTVEGSGWVHTADLTTAQSAHGVIYLEADVNTDGDVTHVDVLADEPKDPSLLQRNIASLMQAKFYPIVQKGQKKAFKYDYRVEY